MLGTVWVASGDGDEWGMVYEAIRAGIKSALIWPDDLPDRLHHSRQYSRLQLTGAMICGYDLQRWAAAVREAVADLHQVTPG